MTAGRCVDPLVDFTSIHKPVGHADEHDRATRRLCLDHAIAVTEGFAPDARVPEALVAAHRFATFIIEGRLPYLRLADSPTATGGDGDA